MGARRSIRVLLLGGALIAALLAGGRLLSGLPAAAAFVLGLFAIPVVVGVAGMYAWHAIELRRSIPGLIKPRRQPQEVRTCLACLERMQPAGDTWVCPQCDHDQAIA